jgi:DNA-binding cell septation regulator SpoVG
MFERNDPGALAGAAEAGIGYARRRSNTTPRRGMPARRPKLKKWTPHRSGALLSFCSVELVSVMILNDLRIMTGNDGLWVAMPAQRQVDRERRTRIDANGRALFSPIIEFRNRAIANKFRDQVLERVRRDHPDALEDGSP